MIKKVRIKNFKSIDKLQVELGRVNVVIGANGSGKSNILEAIGFGAAAMKDRLTNEYLGGRGIRVTMPEFMRSGLESDHHSEAIKIGFILELGNLDGSNHSFNPNVDIHTHNSPFGNSWRILRHFPSVDGSGPLELVVKSGESEETRELSEKESKEFIKKLLPRIQDQFQKELLERFISSGLEDFSSVGDLLLTTVFLNDPHWEFLTYSPENNKIRNFHSETQIEPLGVYGEGLFRLLSIMEPEKLAEIKEHLKLIDWFEDLEVPRSEELNPFERRIRIKDRYINPELKYFDQRSANEGFLFLLFYLTAVVSDLTPKFFAIDNIDNSLNPKLCRSLVKVLAELARKYDKQLILTTHNPAVLDGINLEDPEQKILVAYRNANGATRVRSVEKANPVEGEEPVRLSEQFLRGYLGGLNQGGF